MDRSRFGNGLMVYGLGVARGGFLDTELGFVAVDEGGVPLGVAWSIGALGEGVLAVEGVRVCMADKNTMAWATSGLTGVDGESHERGVVMDPVMKWWVLSGHEEVSQSDVWRELRSDVGVAGFRDAEGQSWVRFRAPSMYCFGPEQGGLQARIVDETSRLVEGEYGLAVTRVVSVPGCVEVCVGKEQLSVDLDGDEIVCGGLTQLWLATLDSTFVPGERQGPVRDKYHAASMLVRMGVETKADVVSFGEAAIRRGDVGEAELVDRYRDGWQAVPHVVCAPGNGSLLGMLVVGSGNTKLAARADAVRCIGDGGGSYPMHVDRKFAEVLGHIGKSGVIFCKEDVGHVWEATPALMELIEGKEYPMVVVRAKSRGNVLGLRGDFRDRDVGAGGRG